jgi:hypothetical protein
VTAKAAKETMPATSQALNLPFCRYRSAGLKPPRRAARITVTTIGNASNNFMTAMPGTESVVTPNSFIRGSLTHQATRKAHDAAKNASHTERQCLSESVLPQATVASSSRQGRVILAAVLDA